MDTATKVKISNLELVFPPLANKCVSWIESGSVTESTLRQSHLYMIGGKAHGKFVNFSHDSETNKLNVSIQQGDVIAGIGALDMEALEPIQPYLDGEVQLGVNEEIIDIFIYENDIKKSIVQLTPEALIFYRSRETIGVEGFDNFREMAHYDLLYIGISKSNDSYQRLIQQGHHARQKFLSDEPQRHPGARVSDEIFLFFFKINPLFISSFGPNHDFSDEDISPTYDYKTIIADAEKAYISLLKPEYNTELYKSYPESSDGLKNTNLQRYSYSIGEHLLFNTSQGVIKGARHQVMGGYSNDADFISVDSTKKTVKFNISGQDFNIQSKL